MDWRVRIYTPARKGLQIYLYLDFGSSNFTSVELVSENTGPLFFLALYDSLPIVILVLSTVGIKSVYFLQIFLFLEPVALLQ